MNTKVEVSITRTFSAEHSLPRIGVASMHKHAYTVECGYSAEIDPATGCAKPMSELARDIDAVLSRLEGRSLNGVLPLPPTAEAVACWILEQLPSHWEWVSIRAYEGFMCRVERRQAAARAPTSRP